MAEFDGKRHERPSSLRYQSQVLSDKRRSKTRVNIGSAFARWSQLKKFQGLKSHAKMATFLLDWYERYRSGRAAQNNGMLNEATEDNLIDLGPGSPAVVTPRITSSPPPHSTANAAASPAHNPTTASLSSALAGLDVASDSVSGTQSSLSGPNQDDFDMFAQTRSSSLAEQRKNVKYEDPQALGGLASALDVRQQNAGGKGDATEEGVTSEEFDKFLEERAKAVDSVPSPPRANPAHPARTPGGSHKKAERTEDALFAL